MAEYYNVRANICIMVLAGELSFYKFYLPTNLGHRKGMKKKRGKYKIGL